MIDITKKYKTNNGRSVELISLEGRGDYPVLGYIADSAHVYKWTREGRYTSLSKYSNELDLVEVVAEPIKRKFYRRKWIINVFEMLNTSCMWCVSIKEFDELYFGCELSPEIETMEV